MKEGLIEQLKTQQLFFMNTIECLSEEDSNFRPNDEMFTVAQHIGHVAETIPWFMDGVFGPNGYDMNFDNYMEKIKKYTSYEATVKEYQAVTEKAINTIKDLNEAELVAPITGEIMKGAPKMAVIGGIADHTAHHRGALSVYARLLGKTPKMPYEGA